MIGRPSSTCTIFPNTQQDLAFCSIVVSVVSSACCIRVVSVVSSACCIRLYVTMGGFCQRSHIPRDRLFSLVGRYGQELAYDDARQIEDLA
jgi:hypothetical protein